MSNELDVQNEWEENTYTHIETKFSGTHGDRGGLIFPVQLTTSRIGNLTRLIHTLLYVMTITVYCIALYQVHL